MPQISLKRLFQAVACLCATFAYASIELRAYQPKTFEAYALIVRTAFAAFCGIGLSAGILFSKASIGVSVTVALIVLFMLCIGWW